MSEWASALVSARQAGRQAGRKDGRKASMCFVGPIVCFCDVGWKFRLWFICISSVEPSINALFDISVNFHCLHSQTFIG